MAKKRPRQQRKPSAQIVDDGAVGRRFKFQFVSPTSAPGRKLLKQLFETYRRRFEEGDGEALLLAVEMVARFFAPAYAAWVPDAFDARLQDFLFFRAASLDEAFGVKRERKHIDRQREIDQWRGPIIQRIAVLEQSGMLREEAFVAVAKTLSAMLGKTMSKDWVEKSVFRDKASRPWRVLFGVNKRPRRRRKLTP
jgi:hypothetical protein